MPSFLRFAVVVLLLPTTPAYAQVFGTFPWQMQPYCNIVTLTLIASPAGFRLEGADDQCGSTNKGSVVGMATFNASGNVTLNFTIGSPTAQTVQVNAIVSPANGEGTWADGNGHVGAFRFFAAAAGLPPRPDGRVFFTAQSQAAALSFQQHVRFTNVRQNSGGGSYDPATGVFRVPSSGFDAISFSVAYVPGPTTADRVCAWIDAGVGIERSSCVPVVAGSNFIALSGATILPLVAGETIAIQSNGPGTTTLAIGPGTGAGLTIFKLRRRRAAIAERTWDGSMRRFATG